MKYYIETFGCQMNRSDSERIAAIFENTGLEKTNDLSSANFAVVNMCSVRQSAVHRIFGMAEKFRKSRLQSPAKVVDSRRNRNNRGSSMKSGLITILTGCILPHDKKKFTELFDYVIPGFKIEKIRHLLSEVAILKRTPQLRGLVPATAGRGARTERAALAASVSGKSLPSALAYLPISNGCNNFCSYCAVPYTRGREKSQSAKIVLQEAKNLVKNGCKEITLLGQNVNSYKSGNTDFCELLRQIEKIPGDFWITFLTNHPKDFSEELIELMKNSQKISHYTHLPIQSGDNGILEKMNRHYTVSQYFKILEKIRKQVPGVAISTDIIVGFPGEEEKQFQNSAKAFKRAKYDIAYINKYSPRIGAVSAKFPETATPIEKKLREKVLTDILRKTALEQNKKWIGKTEKLLIFEKHLKEKNVYFGKMQNQKIVEVRSGKNILGEFKHAKITSATPWHLEGEITSEKTKVIVILGPTASGKTGLSIKLAKKFSAKGGPASGWNGVEIISADSRQVYKGMDLGTGKVTKKEMQGIPHYLLDVVSPKTRFGAGQFQKLANEAIDKIISRKKIPFLVGGTGFYIQSIVDQLEMPAVNPDWKLREKLEKKSAEQLFLMLKKLDTRRARLIDRHNKRRLIRAIEVNKITGKPVPALEKKSPALDFLILGIKKPKTELANLIKIRLEKRLEQGMIKEVEKLHKPPAGGAGVSWKRLEEFGLEYRYIAYFLQNKISYEEMKSKLQKEIEHFAKRQMTWFSAHGGSASGGKRDKKIRWISGERQAEKLAKNFLKI